MTTLSDLEQMDEWRYTNHLLQQAESLMEAANQEQTKQAIRAIHGLDHRAERVNTFVSHVRKRLRRRNDAYFTLLHKRYDIIKLL